MGNCEFKPAGKFMVCTRPGCSNRAPIFNPSLPATKYYATCFSTESPRQPFRLGTLVARGFASIGITQARYVLIKQKLHLAPSCGCKQRETWLNQFDVWDAASWAVALGMLGVGMVWRF